MRISNSFFFRFSFHSINSFLTASTLSGTFPSALPEGFCHPSSRKCLTPHPKRKCFWRFLLRIYTEPVLHQNQEKEEPSSRSSQKLFRPGTLIPLSLPFFLKSSSFLSNTRKLANCSLRFVHQRFLLCFTISSFSSSSFTTSFLFAFSNPQPFNWCF